MTKQARRDAILFFGTFVLIELAVAAWRPQDKMVTAMGSM